MIPLARWVAPFGDPWIKACSQLPKAFRSVPRPSSPLGAKASTRCPYPKPKLTPAQNQCTHASPHTAHTLHAPLSPSRPLPSAQKARAQTRSNPDSFVQRPHPNQPPKEPPRDPKTLARNQPPAQSSCAVRSARRPTATRPGGYRVRTGDPLLAKQALCQLS